MGDDRPGGDPHLIDQVQDLVDMHTLQVRREQKKTAGFRACRGYAAQ